MLSHAHRTRVDTCKRGGRQNRRLLLSKITKDATRMIAASVLKRMQLLEQLTNTCFTSYGTTSSLISGKCTNPTFQALCQQYTNSRDRHAN